MGSNVTNISPLVQPYDIERKDRFVQNNRVEEKKKEDVKNVVELFREPEDEKKVLTSDELEQIASRMKVILKKLKPELRLEIDREANMVVVKIIEPDTEEIIRQIPTSEFLAIKKRMKEIVGLLYDNKT